ncbi:IS1380-Spn1 transposase [Streptococcus pneumoniae]|nr:IS1380-Spn1 transposase [Streptococcus pneumoniae]
MNSLPNHHFQNKSFYQLSFDGGHLTQYGGLIFFQELFTVVIRIQISLSSSSFNC